METVFDLCHKLDARIIDIINTPSKFFRVLIFCWFKGWHNNLDIKPHKEHINDEETPRKNGTTVH